MSNVYKFYVPQEQKNGARVIDANAASEEKIRLNAEREAELKKRAAELAAAELAEEENEPDDEPEEVEIEEDFSPGLFAEQIDPDTGEILGEVPVGVGEEGEDDPEEGENEEPMPEPELPPEPEELVPSPEILVAANAQAEEIIARANEEAEQKLAEANEEANQVRTQAQAEAEQLKAEAKEQGHQEGYASGQAAAEEEINAKFAEIEELRTSLEEERDTALRELEPQLLDVMLTVFNRVFHIQFDDKKEILEHLVMDTIMNVEGSKEFRIKTSEENYQYLSAHLAEIRAQVGEEYGIEVVADSAIGENKCVIETDSGLFDCSLGVHLENLLKDLRSLAV